MVLYHIYSWVGCFNICLLWLLLTDYFTGWFSRWSKAHDGHVIGLVFKWWAIFCLIAGIYLLIYGWNMQEAMNVFSAIPQDHAKKLQNLIVFSRLSMIFMIFTCTIPYVIGREIHSGFKLF